MSEEFEVKFLNINPEQIQKKLEELGANKVGEYFYRRYVFDYPDLRLDKQGAWLRVRTDGLKTTMGFKQRLGMGANGEGSDLGMEEVEGAVDDFDKTVLILKRLGFAEKFYLENKRIHWQKNDVEFDIDFWPELEPYLEIEGDSWESVEEAIKMLGLNSEDKRIFSTTQIYELKGIRDKDYQRMTFDGLVKK